MKSGRDIDPSSFLIVEAVQDEVVDRETELLVLCDMNLIFSCVDFNNDPQFAHKVSQIVLEPFRNKTDHELSVICQ